MGEAQKTATVCFVGLGPGDPKLSTERARERLAAADVVLSDGEAPVERIVGLAREGKRVVRAVAGDALESDAVAVEAMAVARAGVPIEVVPGVGARGSAGAFAGVLGRAVRVPAGDVAAAVEGEPPGAVVTLVASAGWPVQRIAVTTAADAAARAKELGPGPLVIAFGAPHEALGWFVRRPLFGKRVLVTRAREQASAMADLLRDRGAEPVVVPTIAIHPPSDPAPLEAALRRLVGGDYDWAIFTSANGVERTWEALGRAGADARAFGRSRLAAIGPATARALAGHGLVADVVAKEFRGEGLAEALRAAAPVAGSAASRPRALLARAARARDALPAALREAGWEVEVAAAYETRAPAPDAVGALVRAIEGRGVDAVVFTSSSTVDNLCDLLGPAAGRLLSAVRVASIGPVTTGAAVARGLRVDVTAAQYTVPGLVQALEESWV